MFWWCFSLAILYGMMFVIKMYESRYPVAAWYCIIVIIFSFLASLWVRMLMDETSDQAREKVINTYHRVKK